MANINENYLKLKGNYLFAEIAKRVEEYKKSNPNKKIIKLGIGDVTKPLPSEIIKELHNAVDEMGNEETFKGYGPERGYDFLAEKIISEDYVPKNVKLTKEEIFISSGAKSDTANFQEIFSANSKIAVMDPVYPVYIDTNVMSGRSGELCDNGVYEKFIYLPCNKENGFMPRIPKEKVDIIYLCYPNNPTGTTASRNELKKWVDYAKENDAVILFDAAYEAYIRDENIPRSIYQIEGAKEVAVEFRSFSKNAGFTGTRCAFTVVPKEIRIRDENNGVHSLNELWNRRQSTKFNGVPYIIQKAAEAVYSEKGKIQVKELVDFYMENAKIIREGLEKAGYEVYGGINAPYIWIKTPNDLDSWEFFDKLLNKYSVVGTPGAGFGPSGSGYFRLTSFGSRENTIEAIERILKE